MKPKKVPKETRTVYLRNVPVNVHDFFKGACAKRGKTMTAMMIELMKEFVKKEQEK